MPTQQPQEVVSLLQILETAVRDESISESRHLAVLEKLKILGKSPQYAEAIFTEKSISILASIGLNHDSSNVSHEALRCLANALLLKLEARQIFAKLNYANKVVEKLKTKRNDDEFLYSRILFLLTYGTSVDFQNLVSDNGLAEAIIENIERHAEKWTESQSEKDARDIVEEEMAFSETLKLLFNVMHNHPLSERFFTPCLSSIMRCLRSTTFLKHASLQPPNNHLINAMLNFELPTDLAFPESDPPQNLRALINILDSATVDYSESSLDTVVAPLLTLIRRVYEAAPKVVRISAQELLLPSEMERGQPLGKTKSLSSRLLHLSSSPHMSNTRDSISSLLFELSEKNAEKFIRNVGYGHAAGFLVSHNIPLPIAPQLQSEELFNQNNPNMSGHPERSKAVNFVTGQYLDKEPAAEDLPMTEEEKIREAERLFVLFERLNKTGVMKVQNPIHIAMGSGASGRFEEVD